MPMDDHVLIWHKLSLWLLTLPTPNSTKLLKYLGALGPDEFRTFTREQIDVARYVAIHSEDSGFLTLCEVEVYGGKFPSAPCILVRLRYLEISSLCYFNSVSLRCMEVTFLWYLTFCDFEVCGGNFFLWYFDSL